MRKSILLLTLFLPAVAFSQKFYAPSGKPIKLPANIFTIDDVSDYLQPSPKPFIYQVQGYGDDTAATVAFHFLTNWPIFIKCEHPERIKEYTEQFNLESYLGSNEFREDIKKHITYRDLKASYITDKLGEPDAQTEDQDGDTFRDSYDYAKLNCTFLIINGFVTKILSLKTDEQ